MTHITPQFAPISVPQSHIIVLRCAYLLHFDPAPLTLLFAQKSEAVAEEMVCRALEDIAQRLDILQNHLAGSDFANIGRPARRIGIVAAQIGLTEVAVAAEHVWQCATQQDGVALEATMARLERGFDCAVSEVWNFRDRI